MAPRGDPRDNVVSEEMVKLIFLPIKESLATTTAAINEASQQVKDLARLFSTPPGRGDIIKELTAFINSKFDELQEQLDKHSSTCINKTREINQNFVKAIEDHEADIEKSLEYRVTILTKMLEDTIAIVKDNKEVISNFDERLKTSTNNMTSKLNFTISIIGLVFGLSIMAWGVATYIYDANNQVMKQLIDTIKIEQNK